MATEQEFQISVANQLVMLITHYLKFRTLEEFYQISNAQQGTLQCIMHPICTLLIFHLVMHCGIHLHKKS